MKDWCPDVWFAILIILLTLKSVKYFIVDLYIAREPKLKKKKEKLNTCQASGTQPQPHPIAVELHRCGPISAQLLPPVLCISSITLSIVMSICLLTVSSFLYWQELNGFPIVSVKLGSNQMSFSSGSPIPLWRTKKKEKNYSPKLKRKKAHYLLVGGLKRRYHDREQIR